MSDASEIKYVKITGTTATGRRIEKYYAGTEKTAEALFLKIPPEEGGRFLLVN
jgi:hypothetical protein